MLAILSPAKTLLEEKSAVRTTAPRFEHETQELLEILREQSPENLAKLMGISEELAEKNYQRFQKFSTAKAYPALYLFRGDVYRGLDADTLSPDEIQYLKKHLRILSGLYGLLRPLDRIKPYRLEMGTRLLNGRGKNLYAFWGDEIQKQLEKEASDGILINLASQEYSKVIRRDTTALTVYDVDFRELREGEFKMISFFAKHARGEMARFMAANKVRTVEELKHFNLSGYQFHQGLSQDHKLVFTR